MIRLPPISLEAGLPSGSSTAILPTRAVSRSIEPQEPNLAVCFEAHAGGTPRLSIAAPPAARPAPSRTERDRGQVVTGTGALPGLPATPGRARTIEVAYSKKLLSLVLILLAAASIGRRPMPPEERDVSLTFRKNEPGGGATHIEYLQVSNCRGHGKFLDGLAPRDEPTPAPGRRSTEFEHIDALQSWVRGVISGGRWIEGGQGRSRNDRQGHLHAVQIFHRGGGSSATSRAETFQDTISKQSKPRRPRTSSPPGIYDKTYVLSLRSLYICPIARLVECVPC